MKRPSLLLLSAILGMLPASRSPAQNDQPVSTPFVASPPARATRPWRIAFVPKFKSYAQTGKLSSFWAPAWEGARKAGQELGVRVELVVSSAQASSDRDLVEPQIRLVEDLIARHDIDGLIIAPFDSNRLAPVVEAAVASGIPTIAMDTPVNSVLPLTYVGFDNFAAARAVAEWVVNKLGGNGSALILAGPREEQNARDRLNGFLAGLRQGNVNVLNVKSADWDIEPARAQTAAWLKEYSRVDVILAANDLMAIGAAQAVAAAHRRGIIITGFDATKEGMSALRDGRIAATVDQTPGLQALLAVQLMIRHLEKGTKFSPVVLLPVAPLLTQESVVGYPSPRGAK
jgi:ribose transport system substrate-binding protein